MTRCVPSSLHPFIHLEIDYTIFSASASLTSFCSHSKWIIIFVVVTNWFVSIITRQGEGVSLEIGGKICLRPSSQSKPQGFGASFLSDYYLYYICSLLMITFACQNLMVVGSPLSAREDNYDLRSTRRVHWRFLISMCELEQ